MVLLHYGFATATAVVEAAGAAPFEALMVFLRAAAGRVAGRNSQSRHSVKVA